MMNMMRIVDLHRSGVFVVMKGGRIADIDGRSHWDALDDVKSALHRNGLAVSDRVLRTGG